MLVFERHGAVTRLARREQRLRRESGITTYGAGLSSKGSSKGMACTDWYEGDVRDLEKIQSTESRVSRSGFEVSGFGFRDFGSVSRV